MLKLKGAVLVLFDNLGPLLVFYAVNHFLGLKPAIVASVVMAAVQIVYMKSRRQEIPGLLLFSAVMTFVFGGIDLYSTDPFLMKYESGVSNIATAVFFGGSLFAKKSVIQEAYEKRPNAKPLTPDRLAFFRLLTWIWVGYFLLKATAYIWVAQHYSIDQALVMRTVWGSASLYFMLFISIFGGKYLFAFLRKIKYLPEPQLAEGK